MGFKELHFKICIVKNMFHYHIDNLYPYGYRLSMNIPIGVYKKKVSMKPL